VIAPIRHGQKLTRRSALKVVLSREAPRSACAGVAECSAFDGALLDAERLRPAWLRGLLDRADHAGVLAEVAQIGQRDVLGVDPLVGSVEQPGVGAGAGHVVLAAQADR
jgi:hypothetical protein